MADNTGDPVAEAAKRLEVAVDRLAVAANAARSLIDARPVESGAEGAAPREEVRALAERLDMALAKLRAMLGEEE